MGYLCVYFFIVILVLEFTFVPNRQKYGQPSEETPGNLTRGKKSNSVKIGSCYSKCLLLHIFTKTSKTGKGDTCYPCGWLCPRAYDPNDSMCIVGKLITRYVSWRTKQHRGNFLVSTEHCMEINDNETGRLRVLDSSHTETPHPHKVKTNLNYQSDQSIYFNSDRIENVDDCNAACDCDETAKKGNTQLQYRTGGNYSEIILCKLMPFDDVVYCLYYRNSIISNVPSKIDLMSSLITDWGNLKMIFRNSTIIFRGYTVDMGVIQNINWTFVSLLSKIACKICYILICVLVLVVNTTKVIPWNCTKSFLYHGSLSTFSDPIDTCECGISVGKNSLKRRWSKELDFMYLGNNKFYTISASERWSRNSYFIFPLRSNMERVASFSGFNNTSTVSILKLSQMGFYFTGQEELLQCSDCGSLVRARDIATTPSDSKFHVTDRCQFATTGDIKDIGKACENISSQTPVSRFQGGITESNLETGTDVDESNDRVFKEMVNPEESQQGLACDMQDTACQQHTSMCTMKKAGNSSKQTDNETFDANKQEHESQERKNFEWIDEKHHRHEAANATQDSNPSMENLKCEKNGTHSDLIGLSDLTLEHIPADMRNNDMKQFVLEVSKLTVNITVQEKSPHRPNADYNNLGKKHFGSGTAFINGEDHSDTWMKQLNDENKTNCSLPATTSSERNNQGFYFTVTTNRHVVFDDLEAKSAVVEFFYDSADRKDVVRTHGVAIRHSKIFGEYKSYLLCKTSDREFVNWISTARQEVKYRIDKMQEDTKKMLEKNCFIIFHPHGLEKRMSFGRSVVVKYGLITNTSGAKESVYLENKDSLSETSDAYEVLMYNAPTCPGSSGSVVFTFRRKKESSGDPKFCPFLWVHTGVDRTTQLGVSSMEAVDPNTQIYNIEDPAPLSTIVTKLRESVTVTTETSKPTTTVVARSGTPPLYPQFFAVMKRLSSYDNVKYQSRCDHSPAELAIGGFFYTGTSPDCVRCFYCGLGLKAWRPGDDMYVEHQRARPNCGYLKLCMEFKATLNLDLLKEGSNIPVFPDKELTSTLTVSLLERENRLLKLQQFCRMCFRYKPGELFLPCGEVLVCDKCSEILSTCPSCNLKIEATVAVYMS